MSESRQQLSIDLLNSLIEQNAQDIKQKVNAIIVNELNGRPLTVDLSDTIAENFNNVCPNLGDLIFDIQGISDEVLSFEYIQELTAFRELNIYECLQRLQPQPQTGVTGGKRRKSSKKSKKHHRKSNRKSRKHRRKSHRK